MKFDFIPEENCHRYSNWKGGKLRVFNWNIDGDLMYSWTKGKITIDISMNITKLLARKDIDISTANRFVSNRYRKH